MLLARLKLQQGVPNEVYDKIKQLDPRLDSLSGAILAHRAQGDGAFAMALGGAQNSCRLLVYRTADRPALARAMEAALTAKSWKFVPTRPTPTPKRVFARRIAGDRMAVAHLVTPAGDPPITPLLVIEVTPAGTPIPPELGI